MRNSNIDVNNKADISAYRGESENNMYILTTTAKRKNAKRHIVDKSNNIEPLRKLAQNNIDKDRYVVEIYTGKWELVERF